MKARFEDPITEVSKRAPDSDYMITVRDCNAVIFFQLSERAMNKLEAQIRGARALREHGKK